MLEPENLNRTFEISLSNDIIQLAKLANKIAHDKGFYEDDKSIGQSIALQHSELSEALESLRDGNPQSDKIDNYSELEEEYADLIIRILDTAGEHDLDVGGAIIAKMRYNSDRDHKHGKEF